MAYNVKVTASAEADLDATIHYIITELNNPQAACHVLNEVEKTCKVLAETPMVYTACRQPLLKEYRKVTFMRYLTLFKIAGDTVYVERFFSELEDHVNKL